MLAELGARTFSDSYASLNRPEDMAAHLARTFGPERQAAELRNPNLHTLLGETGGAAAAYAQVLRGPAPECVRGEAPWEVARFYVERSWHGCGIAQALMGAVMELARGLGGRILWLGVWERNPRAIAFYRKHGFEDVGTHEFILGSDRQTDRVLARPL